MLPLAERWNGHVWAIQATPSIAAGEFLGVSCPTVTDCIAVGWYPGRGRAEVTLVERWKGGTWTIQSSPSPSGQFKTWLTGVACVTPSTCEVSGYYTTATGPTYTLAEGRSG